MDDTTPYDADAAELAELYQRADDARKAFNAHMDASMPLWAAVRDAQADCEALKRDFKAKHHGLKITNKETTNDQPD